MNPNNAGPNLLEQEPTTLLYKPLGRIITADGFEQYFFNPIPGYEWLTKHLMERQLSDQPSVITVPSCQVCRFTRSNTTNVPHDPTPAIQEMPNVPEKDTVHKQHNGMGDPKAVIQQLAYPVKRKRSESPAFHQSNLEHKEFLMCQFDKIEVKHLQLILESWVKELLPECDWLTKSSPSWWPVNVPFLSPFEMSPGGK